MIDFNLSDDWQPSQTAPKDGTPILISDDAGIGVFYWENRASQLGKSHGGKQMPPRWNGVYFVTELNPVMKNEANGSRSPCPERILSVAGLEDPFVWKPLPPQHQKTRSRKGADDA